MLQPEDVLAAHILYSKVPQHRSRVMQCLDALRLGTRQGGLLRGLLQDGVLNRAQAHYVWEAAVRAKRERGVRLYAQLLEQSGVPAAQLSPIAEQVVTGGGDLATFGRTLVTMGVLQPGYERTSRARAQEAFEQSMHTLTGGEEFRTGQYPVPVVAGAVPQDDAEDAGSATVAMDPRAAAGLLDISSPGAYSAEDEVKTVALGAADIDARLTAETATPAPPPGAGEGEGIARTLDLSPAAAQRFLAGDDDAGPGFVIPPWVDRGDALAGRRIDEFEIVGRVGAGAMGVVYLARQEGHPGRRVALKLLPRGASPEAQGRFKREILANSFFSHPGALEVYGAGGTETGEQYLAVEFFEGKDLGHHLEQLGRLPARLVVQVAIQVLETLAAAHEAGVVHRDIKPDNVLLSVDQRAVRLMDFGIAILKDLGEFQGQVFHTMGQKVTGTPAYISPEQAAGDSVGPPSDLYSLGCTIYHLLSGRLPFDSETSTGYISLHMIEDPRPLADAHPSMRSLPGELVALVDRFLQKEPEERPTGAEALFVLRQVQPSLR